MGRKQTLRRSVRKWVESGKARNAGRGGAGTVLREALLDQMPALGSKRIKTVTKATALADALKRCVANVLPSGQTLGVLYLTDGFSGRLALRHI
jgi:hypothetical protein